MSWTIKNWVVVLILFILTLLFLVFYFWRQLALSEQSFEKATIYINNVKIDAEVKNTDEEKSIGLSGRKTLQKGSGVLFNYKNSPQITVFWMRDMLIPIDIIWIKDNKVIKIDSNIQPPEADTPAYNLKQYPSNVPIDYVLEVNAGFSDKQNIKVGDNVKVNY